MSEFIERQLSNYPRSYLTEFELESLFPRESSNDSRYSKVKRLIAQKKIIRLRRGLYQLTDQLYHMEKPHPYEIAQYIYGPSCISLESALSFHGLIPETVYTITSATSKRSKKFKTPLGLFSYLHLPEEHFFLETEIIEEDGFHFFMAKPWRAICDYIHCYKKNWKNLEPLINSLRIDPYSLPPLNDMMHELLNDFYHNQRVKRFLKGAVQNLQSFNKTTR